MEPLDVAILFGGLAVLGAAILPPLVSRGWVSLPLVYLAAGLAAFAAPIGFHPLSPREHAELFERVSELGVIVALMGAGLELDRRPGWHSWGSTWRLLGIAMPLTIAAVAVLGWWVLGLPVATAVLVGASVAPTDPVLAADVQVESPYEGREPEVRFALTSEAGPNDGLAFPFTNAAIAMAVAGAATGGWFGEWLAVDVAYRLVAGPSAAPSPAP